MRMQLLLNRWLPAIGIRFARMVFESHGQLYKNGISLSNLPVANVIFNVENRLPDK